jgi:hypothetical protein
MAKKRRKRGAPAANNTLRPQIEKNYPLYAYRADNPECVLGEEPLEWVTKAQKNELLDSGAALSYSHGSMLRLKNNRLAGIQVSLSTFGI